MAADAMDHMIDDAARLVDLESRIERGLETFVDVGLALLEIRDGRLYRLARYERFEDYCQEKWANRGLSRPRIYQLMEAAEVSTMVDTPPANERQARELGRLKEPQAIREVWQEVRETHPEPTARVIREAVERRLNPVQEYVCTDCGEVHPTRECPNCSEPVPASRTQGEAILSLVAADPSVQNASLRLAYARAASAVTNQLLSLDPESIAALLDGGSRVSAARFGDSVRVWVDRFDTALRRGVHVVKES